MINIQEQNTDQLYIDYMLSEERIKNLQEMEGMPSKEECDYYAPDEEYDKSSFDVEPEQEYWWAL